MATPASIADRELVLTRIIDVPADKLFKCWTTPERLHEWFCPKRGRSRTPRWTSGPAAPA